MPTVESEQDQANDLSILILVLKRGLDPNVQEDDRKGARIDQSQEVVMQAQLALDNSHYSLWNLPTPRGEGCAMSWCAAVAGVRPGDLLDFFCSFIAVQTTSCAVVTHREGIIYEFVFVIMKSIRTVVKIVPL
jgi:hypothetical protein